jgi:hypothetical protein
MACVTNPQFWIYLIVVIGAITIIRILIPWFISFFGFPAPMPQVMMVVMWVLIACFGVYLLFMLIGCVGPLPSLSPPLHR